jgi:hypothetical protein
MMLVDTEGREYDEIDGVLAAGAYTPSWVSTPTVTDRGVEMYLDVQGGIEDAMKETLHRLLREELEPVVTDARVEDGTPH